MGEVREYEILRVDLLCRLGGDQFLLFFAYSASLHFSAFVLASFLANVFRWMEFPYTIPKGGYYGAASRHMNPYTLCGWLPRRKEQKMSRQKLLQQLIGVTLVVLFLVGCGATAPAPEAPAATSTPKPPTPTPIPPTSTPTPAPPTPTPQPEIGMPVIKGSFELTVTSAKVQDYYEHDYGVLGKFHVGVSSGKVLVLDLVTGNDATTQRVHDWRRNVRDGLLAVTSEYRDGKLIGGAYMVDKQEEYDEYVKRQDDDETIYLIDSQGSRRWPVGMVLEETEGTVHLIIVFPGPEDAKDTSGYRLQFLDFPTINLSTQAAQ
jgi:hypothetical protein